MQSTKGTIKDIEVFCRSKYGGIWLRTSEEYRARRAVEQIARSLDCKVVYWSCIGGFGVYVDGRLVWQADVIDESTTAIKSEVPFPVATAYDGAINDELISAFQTVRKDADRALYCFLDPADFLETELTGSEPRTIRALREMIASIGDFAPEQAKALLFVDRKPAPKVPSIVTVEFPLPNKDEVEVIVQTVIDNLPNSDTVKLDLAENGNRDKVITAVRGLEAEAISNAIKTSVVATGKIVPERLLSSKKAIVSASGFVEWIEPDLLGLRNVGGVELFKARVRSLRARMSTRAQAYGLKRPLALTIAGIPGTSKSLNFRCMIAEWEVPGLMIRNLESKFVGESQANLLEAIRLARAIAPCAVLFDEAEKTFGSAGTDSSGVTMKLLGVLLTEMQKDFDNGTGVFYYFTANYPTMLDGALLRRCGSDVYWVDLPNRTELIAICDVMKRRYSVTADVNSEEIASAAFKAQLTGAEIETSFLDAMTISFEDGERLTETGDVITAMKDIVPVIKSFEKQIDVLREWGKKVRKASLPDVSDKKVQLTEADKKLKSIM